MAILTRPRNLVGLAATVAVFGSAGIVAAPSGSADPVVRITPDPATVDARGYFDRVSATVLDGDGNPLVGEGVIFQKLDADGDRAALICIAATDANGRASCQDDPYANGYGTFGFRSFEIDPTTGDRQFLVYPYCDYHTPCTTDPDAYATGTATFRQEPHCKPFC